MHKTSLLFLCTGMHFCVDGICAAALISGTYADLAYEEIVFCFCLYNLIAFGTQCLGGLLLDLQPKHLPKAILLSLVLLTLGALPAFGLKLQAIFLGLGNCLFHVAGGSLVLRWYKHYKQLGVFVSSGAIGLALGLEEVVSAYVFVIFYSLQVLLFLRGLKNTNLLPNIPKPTIDKQDTSSSNHLLLIVSELLLMLCIVCRGFSGSGLQTDYVFLLPAIFATGKILGGLVADVIGFRKTIILIFVLSFGALQFDGLLPKIVLILSFNMTMPLTLRLLHWINPKRPGLMFGLAAGCLLPGYFFIDAFEIAQHVMVVGQFLALCVAGLIIKNADSSKSVLQLPNSLQNSKVS